MREIGEESTCVNRWIVATKIREALLIELENNCYSLFATCTRMRTRIHDDCREALRVSTHIGAYATARGHGGIFTCSNTARAVKLAVSLCLHYYVNHNVRQ